MRCGRAVPLANDEVTFELIGAGKVIGHGNGDPNSHEDEKGRSRRLFNGLAQLIVQGNRDSRGALEIRATAPGLKPAVLTIPLKAGAPIAEVPAVPYGTWEVVRKGAAARDNAGGLAILATGTMVLPSLAAAEILSEQGINASVVNCRFIKTQTIVRH